MDARITKAEAALFLPATFTPRMSEAESIRLAAARSRDEAVIGRIKRSARRLADAARWLASWPRRQEVFESLDSLSDRELADIGLTRADIGRVFDAGFPAANDRATTGRKAA